MASLQGFDMGLVGGIPAAFTSLTSMDGDEYVRCTRCGFGGCDVRVSGCGCTLHAVSENQDFAWFRQSIGGCLDPESVPVAA